MTNINELRQRIAVVGMPRTLKDKSKHEIREQIKKFNLENEEFNESMRGESYPEGSVEVPAVIGVGNLDKQKIDPNVTTDFPWSKKSGHIVGVGSTPEQKATKEFLEDTAYKQAPNFPINPKRALLPEKWKQNKQFNFFVKKKYAKLRQRMARIYES